MKHALYQRFRFFKAYAGFATPPGRSACALALARAEMAAHDAGIAFVYKLDSEVTWALGSDGEYHASAAYVLHAVLEDEDEQQRSLAAIGGVDADGDAAFYRVLEAQLADVALDALVTADA
jgi:hypothetical protein